MTILGIETSCDETAAAVVTSDPKTKKLSVISSVISSSLPLHATTGGIIPEIAAREQVKYIQPVILRALSILGDNLSTAMSKVDAIAVTYGPGLIGSLLVGVETARTLAFLSQKPIIPVNHLFGHIYANWLKPQRAQGKERSGDEKNKHYALNAKPYTEIHFPVLALVVSGGHTDLVLMKSHEDIKVIGGTRDDAAGEAFDKIGRLLNIPYPAGQMIASLAERGDPKAFILPRPMIGSQDFDFSFSGLKTSVMNLARTQKWNFSDPLYAEKNSQLLSDICASVQYTIINVLTKKTIKAAKTHQVRSIILGGGVAANTMLNLTLKQMIEELLPKTSFFVPEKELCTDNAAMIAAAGFFHDKNVPWQNVTCDPELYYNLT